MRRFAAKPRSWPRSCLLRLDTDARSSPACPTARSVMSSTRQHRDAPREIHLDSAPRSTELSRRRYRSMIAVSKVWRRSFGTLRLTPSALVCNAIVAAGPGVLPSLACARNGRHPRQLVCLSIQQWRISDLFHRATNHLAKMVSDPGFIDLDHLTHRITSITHTGCSLHSMKKPSLAKVQRIGTLSGGVRFSWYVPVHTLRADRQVKRSEPLPQSLFWVISRHSKLTKSCPLHT